jgi:ribonucleotide monophosphatase NagD (HAD superfamily)
MTINDSEVIDYLSFKKRGGKVVLTISDSPNAGYSNETEHIELLQKKVDTYLTFIQSGEIYKKFEKAKGLKIEIYIAGTYDLTGNIANFYKRLSKIVKNAGFELSYEKID